MQSITTFFDHPFFMIVGGITATIFALGVIYKVISWLFGITPIVFRLGLALWRREIAIFGSREVFESIRSSLIDSTIFKEKNIVHIESGNLDKAKKMTIFLVDWETFGERINEVFSAREDHQTAIVIYAKPASIPKETMGDIANRTNTVVVNFRGRLLNDILTCMITTSYKK